MTEFQPLSTYLVLVLDKKKIVLSILRIIADLWTEWKLLITLASRLRVDGRKRRFSNTMKSYTNSCLVPRRLSFDENVRAKEGGKETTGVCTLPVVPCGSSPVARLYLTKNEAPEEEAVQIALRTLCKGCYRISKVFVFFMDGQKSFKYAICGRAFSWTQRKNLSLHKYPDTRLDCLFIKSSQDIYSAGCYRFVFLWHRKCCFYFLESIFPLQHTWICLRE